MDKVITCSVFGVLVLAGAGLERVDHGSTVLKAEEGVLSLPLPFANEGSVRNLLLNALGTGKPAPGQVRIPILADGVAYEAIVTEPGLVRSIPLARGEGR